MAYFFLTRSCVPSINTKCREKGNWGTEYLNGRFSMPTLLCREKSYTYFSFSLLRYSLVNCNMWNQNLAEYGRNGRRKKTCISTLQSQSKWKGTFSWFSEKAQDLQFFYGTLDGRARFALIRFFYYNRKIITYQFFKKWNKILVMVIDYQWTFRIHIPFF